jgi:alkylation response protein AidB-like acyl-CoA dehydrogenase
MSHILLAAEVHNEPSLFFLVPFQEQAGLRFTATLSLWALQDTNTVSIQCDRLTLGYAEQLGRDLTNYFNATHPGMLAYNAAFSLGLARRAVIMFREITLTTSMAALELATFCQRLSDCSVDFYRLASVPAEARSDRHFDDLLETRIAATRLALDAALALIAVTGGRSQLASSSANRLLREITFFMVTTINNDTKRSFARSFLGGKECEAGESGGNSSEELSACRH